MTLTTHAVVGAALASSMPNYPLLGFAAAFASHFVLDAIPHWDYSLSSQKTDGVNHMNDDMRIDKSFVRDLARISLDMSCGIALALLFFTFHSPHLFWVPMVGAFGAVLPDALMFASWKWRHEPLTGLQRFHLWIHAKTRLGKPLLGISLQAAVIALVVIAFRYF